MVLAIPEPTIWVIVKRWGMKLNLAASLVQGGGGGGAQGGGNQKGSAEQGTESYLECLEDGCGMGEWSKMRLRKDVEARSGRLFPLCPGILYSKGNEEHLQSFNQGPNVTKPAFYNDLSGCCVENGLKEDGGKARREAARSANRRKLPWCVETVVAWAKAVAARVLGSG